jgi:hypothetical protein
MSFCNQCGTELFDGAKFCTNCGTAVGSAATKTRFDPAPEAASTDGRSTYSTPPISPDPARPVVSGARGGFGWVLPALVAVAVLIIGYLLLAPRPDSPAADTSNTAVATDQAGVRPAPRADRRSVDEASDAATVAGANTRASNSVSAAVLDSAFNSDPASAALRYRGPIRVSGTIATMVQPGPTPSLSMEGRTRFNFMIVEFPEGYRTRLAPLAKGQFVSVTCDQVRSLGGTTILSGCLLA